LVEQIGQQYDTLDSCVGRTGREGWGVKGGTQQ
jgi:hypothetical protein